MNENDKLALENGAEESEKPNNEADGSEAMATERSFTAAKLTRVGEEAAEDVSAESEDVAAEAVGESGGEEAVSETPKKKKPRVVSVYDYLETFCYALALMMLLFLFVFRYVSVDGESMMDTLHDEDKLIISNLFYTPETGDIVVINPESHGGSGEPIIKRVIATEGQTVYIDYEKWEVYVDGVKLDEPYIDAMREIEQQRWGDDVAMHGTTVPKYKQEFTVGKGKVFVMGDNRNNSKDSRSREYGEMDENRILGRVIIRLTPFGIVE